MRLHKCDGLTSELLFGSLHTYVINNPYIPRVVMHPKFVAALYEQDIALLHLDEELVFSASVLPICLPPPGAGKMKRTEVYGLIVLGFRHRKIPLPWTFGNIDRLGKALGQRSLG